MASPSPMTPETKEVPARPSRALLLPGLVALLIGFLGYFSQYFLITSSEALPPAGPSRNQLVIFNVLLLNLWIAFWRSIFVDAGRIENPRGPEEKQDATKVNGRWCSKCQAPKPERAHHCRICKRCIPKMDHHCPWTANCVSHTTLPHFIRFLVFACLALLYLLSFLGGRILPIWQDRALPSYLGPSVLQLFTLVLLTFITFGTLFMVGVITLKSLYNLAMNMTSIESWEVERHEMILRRARRQHGFVDVPGGGKVKVQRIEFPYEVGIWRNIELGMGTSVWFWLWVFVKSPVYDSGVEYERNDFNEDENAPWPPLDPDRMEFSRPPKDFKVLDDEITDPDERIAAFRARQENDLRLRRRNNRIALHVGYLRSEIEEEDDYDFAEVDADEDYDEAESKLPSEKARGGIPRRDRWMNREGERLEDFGVDGSED